MQSIIHPVLLLLGVVSLFLTGSCNVIFDVFEYGTNYRHLNSPMKFLEPSEDITEVCEGESFMLQCPHNTRIVLGDDSMIQFGRGGYWEDKTRCGRRLDNVTGCTTVGAKDQILSMCPGREVCGLHLNGMFRGADPCPGHQDNYSTRPAYLARPRKYLTVRFSCVSNWSYVDLETTTQRIRRNDMSKARYQPPTESAETHSTGREHQLFNKLDSVTEINDDVKEYVTHFFDEAFTNLRYAVRFGEETNRTSMMSLTERVGSKLMELLDDQKDITEFEVETRDLTLKLVKKKFVKNENNNSETKWRTSDTKIVLPDQEELVKDDRLEITMASYNNLQEELESASDIITVSVNKPVNLSKPVTFLLPNNGSSNVSCAFWSFRQDLWSKDGCETVCHNSTHTMCSCSHLTNFALIFNVHEEFVGELNVHGEKLETITYVGFTISIICMALTVLVFITTRGSNSSERDVIHINLCISLLTAEIIFIFGISEASNATLCSLIAVLLHYFFLASFAWMFLEGFQIYKMLFKVFDVSTKSSRVNNFVVGYIVPLFIVFISFVLDLLIIQSYKSSHHQDDYSMCVAPWEWSSYGTSKYCWLRVDNHFVLSFIIPAVFVIGSNIGFLLFALYSMFVHKFKPSNQSSHDLVVSYMKGVGVLMALLGSTWIFGLLFLAFNSLFLAYSFTILNSLQGVGIFVFQCLLNPAIRSVCARKSSSLLMSLGIKDSRGEYRSTSVEISTREPGDPARGARRSDGSCMDTNSSSVPD